MAPSAFARRRAASSARREIAWPVNGSRIWWTLVEGGPASRCGRSGSRPPAGEHQRRPRSESASIALMSSSSPPAARGRRRSARRRPAAWPASAAGATARAAAPARGAAATRRRRCRWCRARRATSAAASTTSSRSSIKSVGAEHRGQLAQRGKLLLLALGHPLLRRLHPEQVEVGSEPLRRAPGSPHQALRASLRANQGQDPLADRLWRVGLDPLLARVPTRSRSTTRRFDSTSSATWRSATSRSAAQVLDPEEVVERRLDGLGPGRPCRPAGARSGPPG